MDGFCNQNADQLGSLAGPSLLTVYVGVVECAPASLPTVSSSLTHARRMDGRRLRLAEAVSKIDILGQLQPVGHQRCTRLDDSSRMDAFARGPKRDPLMVPCITSLRQNRLVRMSIDKNAVRAR